jgi:hypothetical protein
VLGFDAFEFAHEVVELEVGDGGLVEDVVEVFVVANFFAEGVEFFLDGGGDAWGGHASTMVKAGSNFFAGSTRSMQSRKAPPAAARLFCFLWAVSDLLQLDVAALNKADDIAEMVVILGFVEGGVPDCRS